MDTLLIRARIRPPPVLASHHYALIFLECMDVVD